MRFGEILKSTEKYKRVEEKFDQHVARAFERQDEEDRKRRKVEQEKTEAAGTLDARESELMEETREKRPAEDEVERDNKRSRPGERRDISMEVDGLDGEEIEEDELHIASLEADADEDFGGEVDITECLEMTGRPPISTRWVDVNKGSTESPSVRCRLVARDFKPKGEKDRSDIFAAMPPLEAKKLLFRKAVGGRKEFRNGEWCQQKIMLIDVKKAHLYGELEDHESAFVLPPDGECEQGKCWRLRRWLYGMRPAASAAKYELKVGARGPWWSVGRPARGDDPQQEAPFGGR